MEHYCSLLLLIFSCGVLAQRPQDPNSECKWRQNVTDVQDLAHHKYMVLEDCLYYYLSRNADKEQGKGSALMLLPPTKYGGGSEIISVSVLSVFVRQMWMNEIWKEMHINGYMRVSWRDRRLKWDPSDWKMEELRVKSYGHLWMPDIYSEKHGTSVQASDYTTYQNIKVDNKGNVTARLEFRVQAECETDFANYPDDKKKCCFKLKSHLYEDLVKFNILNHAGIIDLGSLRSTWQINDIFVRQKSETGDRNAEYLEMCLSAQRKSSTLRIELTLPMFITACMVLSAPLFGPFLQQLYVKLFAILLQFICFQFLVDRTPNVGFGDQVPKIYRFYELTAAVSLASLLLTLLLSALSRVPRRLPPPHRLRLFAAAVNTNLCCAGTDGTDAEAADAAKAASESSGGYMSEWRQLFVAANQALGAVVVAVYVIGVVIITL